MVAKEELLEQFQITGCENLSDEILEKCIEFCSLYDKDAEEFINMWIAFAMGHLDGQLEPTLKALEEMKRTTSKSKAENQKQKQNVKLSKVSISEAWMDEESEILGMYISTDKLTVKDFRFSPEEEPERARNVGLSESKVHGNYYKQGQSDCNYHRTTKRPTTSPDLEDTSAGGGCKTQPAECEPSATILEPAASVSPATATLPQSSQLSNSSILGSRELMHFGPKISSWKNEGTARKSTIRRAGPHVPSNARYMFELLKTTSDVRTRVCRTIGFHMTKLWAERRKDETLVTWNVRTRSQHRYRTWGRVCFDSETKQSNPTVMLEGCRKPPKQSSVDSKLWPQVELDVSELRECYFFPGQIVAVEGVNLTESLLKVYEIYSGSFIPPAKTPHLEDDLKIVVGAGPYTECSNLNYQPLWELMTKVAEDEPHLLILIGPFLDYNHPQVQNNGFTCTYQEFFNDLITKIKSYIQGKCTQVVLVASSRDAHHHAVYPTPEYLIPKFVQNPDIHVLPDPCTLDIDGLRLGITSIDCLMHLGREEVTLKLSGTDKLSRVCNYILDQACFYPLYPPAKEANIDSDLWEKYAFLKEKPHMLLLPSDMRYFCKNISESIILNPSRLSKRSFARINVKPSKEETWSQNNISCEIIKM